MLCGLLALCLVHGLTVTAGVQAPPDLDALRDIGFAQGILDGNWFGDPSYGGTLRYYPPLVPALSALAIRLAGIEDVPRFWVAVGPYVGLLPVAAFFVFARAMAGAVVAACGTAVFVLVNAANADPWIGGGYTPWLLVPLVAQAGLLAAATLIHTRAGRTAWLDAPMIGLAIGTVFLAHPVPGVLLGAIAAAAVAAAPRIDGRGMIGQDVDGTGNGGQKIGARGIDARGAAWLALTGACAAVPAAFYVLPLLLAYPAGIAHRAPGGWTSQALAGDWRALAEMNAPWAIAAIVLWRSRGLQRGARAIAGIWIGICLFELGRHFACGAPGEGPEVCRIGRIPAHHFYLYLQIAGAFLIGAALPILARRFLAQGSPPRAGRFGAGRLGTGRLGAGRFILGIAAAAALAFGAAGLLTRDYDRRVRDLALNHTDVFVMDLPVYRWILRSVPPDGVFATFAHGDRDGDFDSAVFTAMAAGRRLVAAHHLFSNPYVDWTSREAARHAIAAWLTGDGPPPPATLFATGLWAIAKRDVPVRADRADLVFESRTHKVYAIRPGR